MWQPIDTARPIQFVTVVLLGRDNGNGGVMPAAFDGENWRALTLAGLMIYKDPTHWMPLPEPPKGETQ